MLIIFRIMWPYIFRLVMKQGSERMAAYLEARRQQRSEIVHSVTVLEAEDEVYPVADERVDSPLQIVCASPPPPSFFNSDAFWFTLSGIALGIAISIVVAVIKRATEKLQ